MKRTPNHPVLAGTALAALAITVLAIAGPLSPPGGPVASTSPSLADLEAALATSTAGPADTSSTPGSALDGKPLSVPDAVRVFAELQVGGVTTGFWHVSDLGRTTEIVEYRDGQEPMNAIPLPGANALPAVSLIRPLSSDLSANDWYTLVESGDIVAARQDAELCVFDESGVLIAKWSLRQAWPWSLDVRCDGGACAEQLTIIMEHLIRVQ